MTIGRLGWEIREMEALRQRQAVKDAVLRSVQYEIFTARQAIEGQTFYPETAAERADMDGHERRLRDLLRREEALTRELADLARHITRLRDALSLER